MFRTSAKVAAQALVIVLASSLVAVATNAVRSDGIPLVTDIEYEIFAPCKDSEADAAAADTQDLNRSGTGSTMYVDARPAEAFAAEHVSGAVNVPYSVLFGASPQDLDALKKEVGTAHPDTVLVYGVYADPADPDTKVDFAKPLAQQLVDVGIKGVKHLEGGMEELKKNGVPSVKGTGGEN